MVVSTEELINLRALFDKYDTSKDGKIQSSELAALLKDTGSKRPAEEADAVIKTLDVNSDGSLSYGEFLKAFAHTQHKGDGRLEQFLEDCVQKSKQLGHLTAKRTITYHAHDGVSKVKLAGPFNHWHGEEMKKGPGHNEYQLTVSLPFGHQAFKFKQKKRTYSPSPNPETQRARPSSVYSSPRSPSFSPMQSRAFNASSLANSQVISASDEAIQKAILIKERKQLKRVQAEMVAMTAKLSQIEVLAAQLSSQQKQSSEVPGSISSKFSEINNRIYLLDRVFYSNDERLRDSSATKINALVRGFLTRRRFQAAKMALQSYRERQTRDVRGMITGWLAKRTMLYRRVKARQGKELQVIGKIVFMAWREVVKPFSAQWKVLRQKEKQLATKHITSIAQRGLREWRDIAMGSHSRKAIARNQREKIRTTGLSTRSEKRLFLTSSVAASVSEDAEGRLEALHDKITKAEKLEEAVNYIYNIRIKGFLRVIMTAWRIVAARQERRKKNTKYLLATRHYQKNFLRKIIYKWHEEIVIEKYERHPERWRFRKNKKVYISFY